MPSLRHRLGQLNTFCLILKHFRNPFAIILLRSGLLRVPYFPYRIDCGDAHYEMLARPTRTSMADLFILKEVLVEQIYRDILPFLPKGRLRIVDVGANIGAFTIWLRQQAEIAEAFCFEPEPDSFRLLSFNLSRNGCGFAHALPCAVGGTERMIEIVLKESAPGGTSIYGAAPDEKPRSGTPVRVRAFAEWLRGVNGDFDVLKLDCEGAEWEIIHETPPELFRRFRVILAELHADPVRSTALPEFRRFLESTGFRTVRDENKIFGLYLGVRD